jgi:hypothetical protein
MDFGRTVKHGHQQNALAPSVHFVFFLVGTGTEVFSGGRCWPPPPVAFSCFMMLPFVVEN